jgi:hypothetical protein
LIRAFTSIAWAEVARNPSTNARNSVAEKLRNLTRCIDLSRILMAWM